MQRTLFLIIFLILLPSTLVRAEPIISIVNPQITLEEPVTKGEIAHGEFTIVNNGDEELVIKSVAPG